MSLRIRVQTVIIGSLSKDDGDGNENGKKAIGLDKRERARSLSLG